VRGSVGTALLAAALSCLSSCTTAASSGVTVQVSRPVSLVDSVAPITVSGLPAHHRVVVGAQTRSANGTVFSSRETFRSDAHGTVDLGHDPAVAGSYRGVSPMGLLWAMHPQPQPEGPVGYSDRVDDKGQTVELTVSVDGRSVASASFRRRAAAPRGDAAQAHGQQGRIRRDLLLARQHRNTATRRGAARWLGGRAARHPGG